MCTVNPTMTNKKRTVIFVFAGRKKYLEILKKYLMAIINSHEEVELHFWNFCRNSADNEYVRALAEAIPRTRIFNQYYEGDNVNNICIKSPGVICTCIKCRVGKWTEPYKFYASDPEYQNCNFIKIDDDILFLSLETFDRFVAQLAGHPDRILTGNVINNGVCAMVDPVISRMVNERGLFELQGMRTNSLMRLLKNIRLALKGEEAKSRVWWRLCTSVDFLKMCHSYFLSNRKEVLSVPGTLVPLPQSRFSINVIAFGSSVMKKICEAIGEEFSMNDEEIISNQFPIVMVSDFVACHLHFADQRARLSDPEEDELLRQYDSLANIVVKTKTGLVC